MMSDPGAKRCVSSCRYSLVPELSCATDTSHIAQTVSTILLVHMKLSTFVSCSSWNANTKFQLRPKFPLAFRGCRIFMDTYIAGWGEESHFC